MTTVHEHTAVIPDRSAPACEHGWETRSRHTTSEGIISYQRCAACGVQRIDLLAASAIAPRAISIDIGPLQRI